MIQLAQDDLCNGCQACGNACPKDAITFGPDDEGFLHPSIDAAKCVGCQACERVCPVLHRGEPRQPLAVCAALAKDTELRMQSSSGGIFSLLARQAIAQGGIVFGAAWSPDFRSVIFASAENEAELAALRGSKYVQADVGDAYRRAKAALAAGRQVLFSGTPCQIAALRRCLGREESNLLCVDVICNSVPSPLIYSLWRDRCVRDAGGDLVSVSFRDKESGWRNPRVNFTTTATTAKVNLYRTVYYGLWQQGYTVRPSCMTCEFRELRSGSDITIGDAWGIETMGRAAALDDGKGVSLVLMNSGKGMKAVSGIAESMDFAPCDYETAVRTNPALVNTAGYLFAAGKKRMLFWKALQKSGDLDAAGVIFTRPPLWRQMRAYCGQFLRRAGLRK